MTSRTTAFRAVPAGSLVLALCLVFAACSSGSAPATSSPTSSQPTPSASPSDASSDGREPGDVGNLPPETPVGGGVEPGAGGGGQPPGVAEPPGTGQPQVVQPRPGTVDPHEVGITTLLAKVEGRQVLLNARWWSGIEPCNVLDHIAVDRQGDTFTIGLFEGSGDPEAMCIEIAVEKLTLIDLGELEPGTYTIEASSGEAEPISVVVG